ncbi:MAG: patatin-like phospholipase family protein [Reichenbachiella sp.]|uniref:patatin-like phospholipase family protein n=1 Tax=Reichenbachiella sp. TaxID=2184521 RepID=UPI003266209E
MKGLEKGKKIGLALGGGAALGAVHIGVLKALEELDIEVAYITGTSIGALIASLHAFGKTSNEIEDVVTDLKWLDVSGLSLSRYGLLSNDKLGDLINDCIGSVRFEDSNIPLAMIATNITTGEKVIIEKNDVAAGVMASTCIPGVFIPIEIEDQLLVDGGIVENVPISPLRKMGADLIIGIDLNGQHTHKRPENIIEVLLNSFDFTMLTSAKMQNREADILIQPNLSSFNRVDIDQAPQLIDVGYKTALDVLKEEV